MDACWVRSGWCYDTLTLVWRHISDGCLIDSEYQDDDPRFSPGATLAVPLHLAPGESRRVTLRLNWYVPHSGLHAGIPEAMLSTADLDYQPWYTSRFSCIDDATADWAARYGELRRDTLTFSDALFDSDLPDELLEAVADTLSVLKSPLCSARRTGASGHGKAAKIPVVPATVPAPTCGTISRRFATFSRGWNVPCAKRNFSFPKTRKGTRISVRRCRFR
ncbi:MAG: GH116 family glycosyl-hydrolase [Lachnospiraceae bacterium]